MSIENALRKVPEEEIFEEPQTQSVRTLEAANDEEVSAFSRTIEPYANDNEMSQPIRTIEPFANDNEPPTNAESAVVMSDEEKIAEVREHLGMFVPINVTEEVSQLSEKSIEAAIEQIGTSEGSSAEDIVTLSQAANAGAARGAPTTPEDSTGTGSTGGGRAEGGGAATGVLKILWSVLKFGGFILGATLALLLNGLRMASDKVVTTATGVKPGAPPKKAASGHGASHGGGGGHH